MGSRRRRKRLVRAAAAVLILWLGLYLPQRFWAHREPVPDVVCSPLLGWFTREDRRISPGPPLTQAQPGDILLTLSTHSVGWRHGHAGLVIDADTVLECAVLGTDSALGDIDHWRGYSHYVLLRLKGVTPEQQAAVVTFALENLVGVPYRLTAGLWGEKFRSPEQAGFGLQCAYLVWYAYAAFGCDLDSDGGKLVTVSDLLQSDLLEPVQGYGTAAGIF